MRQAVANAGEEKVSTMPCHPCHVVAHISLMHTHAGGQLGCIMTHAASKIVYSAARGYNQTLDIMNNGQIRVKTGAIPIRKYGQVMIKGACIISY